MDEPDFEETMFDEDEQDKNDAIKSLNTTPEMEALLKNAVFLGEVKTNEDATCDGDCPHCKHGRYDEKGELKPGATPE